MTETLDQTDAEAFEALRSCLAGRDPEEPIGRLAEAAVEFIEAQDGLLARRAAELERLRSERREQLDEAVRQRVAELLAANSDLTARLEEAEAKVAELSRPPAPSLTDLLRPYRSFIFSEDIDLLLSEACAEDDQCSCPTCQLGRLRDTLRTILSPTTEET